MASVVHARNAVNMNGVLCGSRSFQKTCHSLAATLRISSRLRGSTESRPRSVPMKVGKKVIRVTIAILDPGPIPNQTMASGASATIGTDADAIAYGQDEAGECRRAARPHRGQDPEAAAQPVPRQRLAERVEAGLHQHRVRSGGGSPR